MAKESVRIIYITESMEMVGTRGDVPGASISQLRRTLTQLRKDGAKVVLLSEAEARGLFVQT